MDGCDRVNRAKRRKRAVYLQSCCSVEINSCNGLVQMEDRGGQEELGGETALHPSGASGRSEVAVLGQDSYLKPCWPLNAGTSLYCSRHPLT